MTDEILLEVDDPAVLELLPRYLKRRAQDVVTMREALATSSFAAIAQLGHRLRGSGSAYGMPFVTQVGRQLENAALAADAVVIEQALTNLDAYLGRVRIA